VEEQRFSAAEAFTIDAGFSPSGRISYWLRLLPELFQQQSCEESRSDAIH